MALHIELQDSMRDIVIVIVEHVLQYYYISWGTYAGLLLVCNSMLGSKRNGESGQGLATLAASEADRLSVLLELGNELIALLDHVVVLLILVVWSVRFDDFVDSVNGARHSISGDEV
jgi:hypothetical protein